ncbi:MAG: hypothetical protein HY369_01320 [Candidatus Aenigmarchaeota archaeon]|nr:hypothetical protein [Candidatus Aenigmarchaeota archaeon]
MPTPSYTAIDSLHAAMDLFPDLPWSVSTLTGFGGIAHAVLQPRKALAPRVPYRALVAIQQAEAASLADFLQVTGPAQVLVLAGTYIDLDKGTGSLSRPGERVILKPGHHARVEAFCLLLYETLPS